MSKYKFVLLELIETIRTEPVSEKYTWIHERSGTTESQINEKDAES